MTRKVGLTWVSISTHLYIFSEQGRGREEQYGGVATCGTPEALVAIATSVSSFRTTASATTATTKTTLKMADVQGKLL